MSMKQRRSPEEIGRRYIHVFATPASTSEIRSRIEEFVAGDHITYGTSWGTLLGRTALKKYVEVCQAAFPTLSYRVTDVTSSEGVVYCMWMVEESHWIRRWKAEIESVADLHTMAIRITRDRITETWNPCDPWVPFSAAVPVTPPNRIER